MKQVRYYILNEKSQILSMPKGAKILHVDEHYNSICIWAEVYPDRPEEDRRFAIVGTGQFLMRDNELDIKYLGTVKQDGGELVWHVYEYKSIRALGKQ